jgi:hypothetical protein
MLFDTFNRLTIDLAAKPIYSAGLRSLSPTRIGSRTAKMLNIFSCYSVVVLAISYPASKFEC